MACRRRCIYSLIILRHINSNLSFIASSMHSTLMKCIRNVTSVRLYGMPHTCDPPDAVGIAFSADVIKRARQLILVVRDCATSYTTTCLVEDERCHTTGSAMIRLCVELVPLDGPLAVRTYPAPGSTALVDDKLLRHHRITIEIGRAKNKNKNPVTEKQFASWKTSRCVNTLWMVQ